MKSARPSLTQTPAPAAWEVCILAGGASSRMGRDKARLRLGSRTLLGHARATAAELGVPVRVIRRDAVPRCGPLSGVVTALQRTRAGHVLFLACDMPWVSSALLRALIGRVSPSRRAVFTRSGGRVGFPFVLGRDALPTVTGQIARKAFSLQALAQRLGAQLWTPPKRWQPQLRNLNTPQEWEQARLAWRRDAGRPRPRPIAPRVACQRRRASVR